GRRPTVFGDGLQTRDYVYVGDVVAANLAAATADVRGPYNIGTGRESSVLDLVGALAQLSGRPFEAEHAPERLGEVRHIALDCSKAKADFGWEARVGLDEGLRLTLDSLS